jgi:hypothetical protein
MTMSARATARRADIRKPPATVGKGWKILDAPKVPHAELEAFGRNVWDTMMHGAPWPATWGARWAALDHAIGLCLYRECLVLIDEAYVRNRAGRDDLTTVVVHELSHVIHEDEVVAGQIHGPKFNHTLASARAFVTEPVAAIPSPTPLQGPQVHQHGGGLTMDNEWEYAALKRDDGTPIPRTAARRSFEKFQAAVRAAGGRAPTGPNGQPMVWNEARGWFPRSTPTPSEGTPRLKAMLQQQLRVMQEIAADARLARGETDLGRRLHAKRARLAGRTSRRREARRRRDRAVRMGQRERPGLDGALSGGVGWIKTSLPRRVRGPAPGHRFPPGRIPHGAVRAEGVARAVKRSGRGRELAMRALRVC